MKWICLRIALMGLQQSFRQGIIPCPVSEGAEIVALLCMAAPVCDVQSITSSAVLGARRDSDNASAFSFSIWRFTQILMFISPEL